MNVPLKAQLTRALKALRNSQPFNAVATSSVRRIFSSTGLSSELIVKHLHRLGDVSAELPNGRTLRLWSRADDSVSNQLFWKGWRGVDEAVPIFYELALRARVTLDIGAFVGYYAILAGHANARGAVYAFEPLPAIYQRLCSNVKRNELANVQCVHSAVGEREGSADFYHSTATELPSSSSLSLEFMRGTPGLACDQVPVVTIDAFVERNQLSGIDLIKIDTESTEPEVLRGMRKTLERDRPTIVCEVLHGRGAEAALDEIFAAHGYSYYLLTPSGPELRARVEGHPQFYNYLFTPRPLNAASGPVQPTT
jgi:FkbM family methyltransferase